MGHLTPLRREIPWRRHCHRADDIATAMQIAEEFGYDLVIDHGTEAHLLADIIAAKGIRWCRSASSPTRRPRP